uniref:Rib/alpha-like domain-containing protein n=1 Tax=Mammaliicoccus lentus TaxID=42858 RepID=UPI00264973CE
MDKQRRLQKFSIRKYTVGTCSILIGTLIFLGSPTDHAFASENNLDVTKQEESAKVKEEKEIDKHVEEADKSTEENKQQSEGFSTKQPTTEESTEEINVQPKAEEKDNQQIEQEKSKSTEGLDNKVETTDKQEPAVKEEKAEEVKTYKEVSKPEAKQSVVKEDNKSQKEVEQIQKETTDSDNKSVETDKSESISEQPSDQPTNTINVLDKAKETTNEVTVESFKKLTPKEIKNASLEDLKKLNVQSFFYELSLEQQKALSLNKNYNILYRINKPEINARPFRISTRASSTGIAVEKDYGDLGNRDTGGYDSWTSGNTYSDLVGMDLRSVTRSGQNAIIRYEIRFNDSAIHRGHTTYYFGASEGRINILRVEQNGKQVNPNIFTDRNLDKTFRAKDGSVYDDAKDFFTPITSSIKAIDARINTKTVVTFEVEVPLSKLLTKYEDPKKSTEWKSFHIAAGAWTPKYNAFRYRGIKEVNISPVIQTDLTNKANTKDAVVVNAVPGVNVKLYDKNNNEIGQAVADNNGNATITPTKPIPAGNVTAKMETKGRHLDPSAPRVATVRSVDADKYNPQGKNQTVELNATPNAESSVNTTGLPNGTRYQYTSTVDTRTPGNKNATVRVTYPDGTHDDVNVTVTVRDTMPPTAPALQNKTSEKGVAIQPITIPNATDNSGTVAPTSVTGLPPGLTYNSQTKQITGTPTTEGTSTITVTYRDPSGNSVNKTFTYKVTDTTAPAKPVIQTDLTGKAGTTTPVSVQAEPNSKVELFDKNGQKIGEGNANAQGNVTITP